MKKLKQYYTGNANALEVLGLLMPNVYLWVEVDDQETSDCPPEHCWARLFLSVPVGKHLMVEAKSIWAMIETPDDSEGIRWHVLQQLLPSAIRRCLRYTQPLGQHSYRQLRRRLRRLLRTVRCAAAETNV